MRGQILAQGRAVQQFGLPLQVVSEWGLDHCLCRCTCFEGLDDTGGSQAWHTVNFSGGVRTKSGFPDSTPGLLNLSSLVWSLGICVFQQTLPPGGASDTLSSGVWVWHNPSFSSETPEEQFVSLSLVELEKSGQI